ncbi:MAG: MoaD/ThiS family protein [Deferribacterota bacterium]|nr:MoaD/ThiS family protein [Deferribacterota bacterium]
MIEIKVYANLRKEFGIDKGFTLKYDNKGKSLTVKELLDKYNVSPDKIAIILINGKNANLQSLTNDGDRVAFFSPVAGG